MIGKIILILAVIIAVILLFIGLTAYQAVGVLRMIKDDEFSAKFQSLAEGNCEDYASILDEMNNRIDKLKFSCMNPVLVFISSKSENDLCAGLKDSENDLFNLMKEIELRCVQED